MCAIAAAAFVAIFAMNVPFPAIVAAAAFIGYIGSRLAPHTFTVGGSHKKANESYGAALIDDDTPTPEHAVFRWSSLRRVLLAGGALRSEEHTSELQSLMRTSYAVFCLKKKIQIA